MLPTVKLTPNDTDLNTADSISGSRAYTFIDSYLYMRNSRYNALYEKNKEILSIENLAVKNKSPEYLYDAFVEQVRILDSVVARIRNFTFRIKEDVLQNIRQILPSSSKISEFEDAISKATNIPAFKYIRYNIQPIEYSSMSTFYSMFNQELSQLTRTGEHLNRTEPVRNSRATNYLLNVEGYNSYKDGLLTMEEIKVMTSSRLISILNFYKRKSRLISTVTKDFKVFQFYLREYRTLDNILDKMKPTVTKNGIILDGELISFNDYFVIYKHFSSMMKYLLDVVSYYDSRFFNKIYALQSNIEAYNSIMDYVISYAKSQKDGTEPPSKEALTEACWDGFMNSDVINAHNLINGNSQAQMLLWDDTSDNTEEEVIEHNIEEEYTDDGVELGDSIENEKLTDEELRRVEEDLPIEEETSWLQDTGEEAGSICTARSSIVF